MYNMNFTLAQITDNVTLGGQTSPGRIYRAGLSDEAGSISKARRRRLILTAAELATGLGAAGGLTYLHRKKNVGWYCSILASLVWAGIGAHTLRYLTGLIWEAADPIKED